MLSVVLEPTPVTDLVCRLPQHTADCGLTRTVSSASMLVSSNSPLSSTLSTPSMSSSSSTLSCTVGTCTPPLSPIEPPPLPLPPLPISPSPPSPKHCLSPMKSPTSRCGKKTARKTTLANFKKHKKMNRSIPQDPFKPTPMQLTSPADLSASSSSEKSTARSMQPSLTPRRSDDISSRVVWVPPRLYFHVNEEMVQDALKTPIPQDSFLSTIPSFTFSNKYTQFLKSLQDDPLVTPMWYPALVMLAPKKISQTLSQDEIYISFLNNRTTTVVLRSAVIPFTGQDELFKYYATFYNDQLLGNQGVQNGLSLLARLDTPTSVFSRHKKRGVSQRELTSLSSFFYVVDTADLPPARRAKLSATSSRPIPTSTRTTTSTSAATTAATPEPLSRSLVDDDDDLSSVPASPNPSETPVIQENSKLLSTLHPCIRTSEHRYQQSKHVLDVLKLQGDESAILNELKKLQMEYKIVRLMAVELCQTTTPFANKKNPSHPPTGIPLNPLRPKNPRKNQKAAFLSHSRRKQKRN